MTRLCYAGLIVAVCACAPRSTVPTPSDSSSMASDTAAVTLYRSPCYAGCPVYEVAVTQDGLVRYEGREGVLRRGTQSARIPPERVTALVRELKAAGYFRFAGRYRPSERVCGRYVPDAPTVITTVTLAGETKRIEHDHGCGGAPMALKVLESRIDEVLNTGRWTGR